MGYGTHATFAVMRCPYCGGSDVDDVDEGPSTHHRTCPKKPLWIKFAEGIHGWYLLLIGIIAIVSTIAHVVWWLP